MATPSTQRPPPPAGHATRSVHDQINGRDPSIICIDSDDAVTGRIDANPVPDWADIDAPPSRPLGPEDAEFQPPPPILAAAAAAAAAPLASSVPAAPAAHDAAAVPVAPIALRRSTRTRVNPRHDPMTITTPPEPRPRRKRPAEDDPSSTSKKSRVEAQAPVASSASRRPGTLRTAVGAARYDDPSFAPANSSSNAKRKRLSDGDSQNKVARTARTQHTHAGASNASKVLPPVASSYPIPPVPAAANTRPPLGASGWPSSHKLVSTQRSRPRDDQAAASSNVVSPDAPSPPGAGLPVDDSEGHFIVRPGDNITPRFKILSQLGQGTFGKVVECFDRTQRTRVAIKVIRAVQKYRDASQIEIRVLRTLREHDPNNENRCIHLVSTFNYKNHVCIVSELLSKSVFDFLKENEFHAFPSTHIWSFAKQLLKSVAFLHSLHLVHTDLKPENILLEDTDYVTKPYSSRSANSKRWKMLRNTALRLIDFGSATFNDEYHSAVVSTRHYRAPEIMLGMGWSFPCDAWSIGCILIEFHTGDALFQTHDNLEHLAMMEAVLGPMPDDFRARAERYKPEYFRNGRLNFPNSQTPRNSQRYVRGMKKIGDMLSYPGQYHKHNIRFLHLLRRLLEYDPAKRITVHDALRHPYFDLSANEFPP